MCQEADFAKDLLSRYMYWRIAPSCPASQFDKSHCTAEPCEANQSISFMDCRVAYILCLWRHVLLHPFRHVQENFSVYHPVHSTATTVMATNDEIGAVRLVPKTMMVGSLVSKGVLGMKSNYQPHHVLGEKCRSGKTLRVARSQMKEYRCKRAMRHRLDTACIPKRSSCGSLRVFNSFLKLCVACSSRVVALILPSCSENSLCFRCPSHRL